MIEALGDLAVDTGNAIIYKVGPKHLIEFGLGSMVLVDRIQKIILFNAYSIVDRALACSLQEEEEESYTALADYNFANTITNLIKYRFIHESCN